jgi:hypothetical protein
VTGTKVKSQHAIIYTGPTAPRELPSERPQPDELPMGEPIRVIGRIPWESKMDVMSRVNFLKVYTVEHNVKVEDFGYVDPADEWKLTSQWNQHWGREGSARLSSADRRSYSGVSTSMPDTSRASQPFVPHGGVDASPESSEVIRGEGIQAGHGSDWRSSASMSPILEHATVGHQQAQQMPYTQPATHSGTEASAYDETLSTVGPAYEYPEPPPNSRSYGPQASNRSNRGSGRNGRRGSQQ